MFKTALKIYDMTVEFTAHFVIWSSYY